MRSPARLPGARRARAAFRLILGKLLLWLGNRPPVRRAYASLRAALHSRRLAAALEPGLRAAEQARRDAATRVVLACWNPKDGAPIDYVNWTLTEWCNYRCPYCPQTHERSASKGDFTAHAFDNHPLERWLDALARHYRRRRLSLKLTGGEPMLDRTNMVPLLEALTAMPTVVSVRIDTNGSFSAEPYRAIDHAKVHLMCTFHPSEIEEASFLERVAQLRAAGFRIGMVNFVMTSDAVHRYASLRERLAEWGIPLHPNPLWQDGGRYAAADVALLAEELPRLDFEYRTQLSSPAGQRCLFPMLAYELDQNGRVRVGCHPQRSGSFFDPELPPLFSEPVACPHRSCVCLDMYSFLEGIDRNRAPDPLTSYSSLLMRRPVRART